MPDLTFEHMEPYFVNVGSINVANLYQPGEDPRDIAANFPTPPDIALRRYAENRLKPDQGRGGTDTLHFVIDHIHMYHRTADGEGTFNQWFGTGGKDIYDLQIKIRLYTEAIDGQQSQHSILTLNREMSIPANYSLAEKEHEQVKFMEKMMADVDTVVTDTLRNKMNLSGGLMPVRHYGDANPVYRAEHGKPMQFAQAFMGIKVPKAKGLTVMDLLTSPEIRFAVN